MSDEPYHLARFVAAQDAVWPSVLAELGAGQKRSHWMWFVFPQFAGLGASAMSQRYAIGSLAEARAYLAHPVLGPRLQECTSLVLRAASRSAEAVFGAVDAAKFRSCMTLFTLAAPAPALFHEALQRFFAGRPDDRTKTLAQAGGGRAVLPGGAALLVLLVATAPAHAQTCVDTRVGTERAYECLNDALARMARGAVTMNTLGATSPAPAVGTFNRTATAERMGSNFGHSVYPQRPLPPVYVNPLVRTPPR